MEAFKKSERAFVLRTAESPKLRPLSPLDWKNAAGFVEVLRYFAIATKIEEGEQYLTLSSLIPVLIVLRQKLTTFIRNKDNCGYGIGFAKNMISSLEDRFTSYPSFMRMKPHCYATFSDPRFKWVYFQDKPEVTAVRDQVVSEIKEQFANSSGNDGIGNGDSSNDDSFWGSFDKCGDRHDQSGTSSAGADYLECQEKQIPFPKWRVFAGNIPISTEYSGSMQCFPRPKIAMNESFHWLPETHLLNAEI